MKFNKQQKSLLMKGNSFNDIQSIKELGLYNLYEELCSFFYEKYGSASSIRFRSRPLEAVNMYGVSFFDDIPTETTEEINEFYLKDDIYLGIDIRIDQENSDGKGVYEIDDDDMAWNLTELEFAIQDIIDNLYRLYFKNGFKTFKLSEIDVNGKPWSKRISLIIG